MIVIKVTEQKYHFTLYSQGIALLVKKTLDHNQTIYIKNYIFHPSLRFFIDTLFASIGSVCL